MRCSRPWSVGSLIQPSMGIALSAAHGQSLRLCSDVCTRSTLTLVEDVAHRAVINDHDSAQIRLHLGQVLDIGPIAECAMLPIIPSREVLALRL